MKEIVLTKGMVAIVDDEDFHRVNELSWSAHKENDDYFYAVSSVKIDKKYKQIRMHRFILGITDPKIKVDHKNGNTLDNRKENIRPSSNAENSRHIQKLFSTNTSGYRGVNLASDSHKRSKPWVARIKVNNKPKHLGYFHTAEEAAKAFDKAAKIYFGDFCGKLNFE